MANLNLPNVREGGDIRFRIGLEDNGVAVDWSGLEGIRVFLYADAQKQVSGECTIEVDAEDNTVLACLYSGDDPQFRGINSVLVRAKYQGEIKVYDKPAINIVARTADADGVLVIDDPVVPVQINVEEVSTSLLNNAIDAAINAAAEAEKAIEDVRDEETAIQAAEAARVLAEQGRVSAEQSRVAQASADHTLAGQDHTRAESDHGTASDDHTLAVSDHGVASGDHTTALGDHSLAESDHTRAEADHGVASSDHTTAQGDHTQAGSDHSTAVADHTQAGADHTVAGQDHTRAGTDHNTAASDHTQAGLDHTQAGEDHTQALADHQVMAGYDNRLDAVEGEVDQLEAKVYKFENGTVGYVRTDGTVGTWAKGYISPFVQVSAGQKVGCHCAAGTDELVISFYDTTKTFVNDAKVVGLGASTIRNYESIAPQDGFVRFMTDKDSISTAWTDSTYWLQSKVLIRADVAEDYSGGDNDLMPLRLGKELNAITKENLFDLHGVKTAQYRLKYGSDDSTTAMTLKVKAGETYTFQVTLSSSQTNAVSIKFGDTTIGQISAGNLTAEFVFVAETSETNNVKVYYYATPATPTTVTISVTSSTSISSDISDLKTGVSALDTIVTGTHETFVFDSASYKPFTFVGGEQYKFTNLSEAAKTIGLWVNTTDEESIQRFDVGAGKTVVITAIADANFVRAAANTTILIEHGTSVVENIENLKKDVADLGQSMNPGFVTEINIRRGYAVDIPFNFYGSKVYDIEITTPESDKQLVLYYGETNIYTWAHFGSQQTVRICRPNDADKIRVSFSGSYATGTCRVRIQEVFSSLHGPDYQFGLGISCRYTVPQQDAFIVPPLNDDRVPFFYSKFDELVTNYPSYVDKVDCDAFVNNLGIETPDYMEGCPIYMYRFRPTLTPNTTSGTASSRSILKVMIVGGTHPEYTAIWDLYLTMKTICESWKNDANLEALRLDAELYVLPCEGAYVVKSGQRTNYNGVDLNHNMPTGLWNESGAGTSTYSGPTAGSEYETKVLIAMFDDVKPHIAIDHHNTNVGDTKNLCYTTSAFQKGVDVGAAHIASMTERWKTRFPTVLPQDNTILGYSRFVEAQGTRSMWFCEQGVLGFTYESNEQIYESGQGANSSDVITIATDGFLNFVLRTCKSFSEWTK